VATTQHTAERQFRFCGGEKIDVKLCLFMWHEVESDKNSYSVNVRLRSLISVVRSRGKYKHFMRQS